MVIKCFTRILTAVIALAVMGMLQACPGGNCVAPAFSINVPFNIFPEVDTLEVGDTLWITARFPDTLKSTGGDYLPYKDGIFCFNPGLAEIVPGRPGYPAEIVDGNSHFEMTLKSGVLGEGRCIVSADHQGNEYLLKIGYKALKPGTFYINNGAIDAYRAGED